MSLRTARPANIAAEIVISGGPCAGKTSTMARLTELLAELGYRALIVPEAATLLIGGGVFDIVHLAINDRDRYLDVQRNLVLTQFELRRRFQQLAGAFAPQPVVLLHDRGIQDDRAYMNADEFLAVLEEAGVSEEDACVSYDGVLFLVSAANGAEDFYTTENNAARSEGLKEARELDRRTLEAWLAHPHLRIVGNETAFEGKLQAACAAVCGLVGIPEPLEFERKYLLAADPPDALLARSIAVRITQTYLSSDDSDVERRVRARQQDGSMSYFLTVKRPSGEARVEVERLISRREYLRLLRDRDPSCQEIRKTRYCFAHANRRFELDVFEGHLAGLALLEVELADSSEIVNVPPELEIDLEVTNDGAYRNRALAERAQGQARP